VTILFVLSVVFLLIDTISFRISSLQSRSIVEAFVRRRVQTRRRRQLAELAMIADQPRQRAILLSQLLEQTRRVDLAGVSCRTSREEQPVAFIAR